VTNDLYVVNTIFQSIPKISNNSPLASLVPLAFVVLLGMLRELLADLKRWREDRRTNARKYVRVNRANLTDKSTVRSDELRVGDIIELNDDQTIPADCMLLKSNQPNG
jgi:P-type E1-E2 ATPase